MLRLYIQWVQCRHTKCRRRFGLKCLILLMIQISETWPALCTPVCHGRAPSTNWFRKNKSLFITSGIIRRFYLSVICEQHFTHKHDYFPCSLLWYVFGHGKAATNITFCSRRRQHKRWYRAAALPRHRKQNSCTEIGIILVFPGDKYTFTLWLLRHQVNVRMWERNISDWIIE